MKLVFQKPVGWQNDMLFLGTNKKAIILISCKEENGNCDTDDI
jgi:hypothetical protein